MRIYQKKLFLKFVENGELVADGRNHKMKKLDRKGTSFAYRVREHGIHTHIHINNWIVLSSRLSSRHVFSILE